MVQLTVSGDYVTVTVNGSIQEEVNKTTDAIEYNKYSDGKVSLSIGRRSFEMVEPTIFEIAGVAVTDASDFVTKLTAVFGSGGGASLLQVATYTLTDSQIKNLPATYVRLLTPTEGKINIAVSISFITDFVTAYADCAVVDQQLLFGYGTYPNDVTIQFIMNTGDNNYLNTLLTKTVPSVGMITPQSLISELGYGIFNDYTSNPLTWYQEGIFIKAFTLADALFTGGNAANTMKITISYIELDI